jgi:hypothetical protein
MVSDPVTPSVEQCCIIKFLIKEKAKPSEIGRGLNGQYVEEILSLANIFDF